MSKSEKCPQCGAPAAKFKEQAKGELAWADEHVIGVASDVDAEILEAREKVYAKAKERHPGRWSGAIRDCSPIREVVLNPAPVEEVATLV